MIDKNGRNINHNYYIIGELDIKEDNQNKR